MSLETQLEIVRNADLYEKRLKELKAAAQEFKDEREKLTKAKDIDGALKQAKALEEEARSALNQAKSEAVATINHANERANQILKEAETKAKQIVSSADQSISETLSQITQKQAELGDLNGRISLLTQQIEALTEKYNALVADVHEKEAEKQNLLSVIADKTRKLKALMVE